MPYICAQVTVPPIGLSHLKYMNISPCCPDMLTDTHSQKYKSTLTCCLQLCVQTTFVIFRESNECPTAEQCLSESIPVVVNNRIVMPLPSETLEMAWEDYRHALKQLKECQSVSIFIISYITVRLHTGALYFICSFFALAECTLARIYSDCDDPSFSSKNIYLKVH